MRIAFLVLSVLPAIAIAAIGEISYSTTFTDAAGLEQAVSFSGTASGAALDGTLTVNGVSQQVVGTIAPDGSISGKLLNPDGSQYGVFWGQRVGTLLKGSFDLGGKVGDWSVPASKLPIPK